MTVHVARSLAAFGAATLVVVGAGASVVATAPPTEPPTGSTSGGPAGCAEIGALFDNQMALVVGLTSGDPAAIEATFAEITEAAAAAAAAAPEEIAAEVATLAASAEDIVTALDGVDLSDSDAVGAALESTETEATAEAYPVVLQWATDNCGYVQPDPFADAPEPAECEELDAAAAAEAAGIDVDVTDLDGSADVSLPGFWTKSCSYGNGAMTVSTLSFTAIENAQQFYTDNLDASAGVVLDVAVGALPESSLVIQTGVAPAADGSVPASEEPSPAVTPAVQVAVFEAPVPFSVAFTGDDIDPVAVVAAAEALLAGQSADGQPPATDVTTTA